MAVAEPADPMKMKFAEYRGVISSVVVKVCNLKEPYACSDCMEVVEHSK